MNMPPYPCRRNANCYNLFDMLKIPLKGFLNRGPGIQLPPGAPSKEFIYKDLLRFPNFAFLVLDSEPRVARPPLVHINKSGARSRWFHSSRSPAFLLHRLLGEVRARPCDALLQALLLPSPASHHSCRYQLPAGGISRVFSLQGRVGCAQKCRDISLMISFCVSAPPPARSPRTKAPAPLP